MRLRDPTPFGWDSDNARPLLRFETATALDGIEIRAFGAEYDDAATQFAVFADGDRILTRRPEQLLVSFVGDIVANQAFTMQVGDEFREVELDDEQQHHLARVQRHLDHEPLDGTQ